MRVLFDSSVLVASLVKAHPAHERAAAWHRRALKGELDFCVSAHSLLEVYAVLTRLPLHPPIQPGMAWRLVRENVAVRARVVAATGNDYKSLVEDVAELGLCGGSVYDALVARAALKAGAEILLTLNPDHFRRAWPSGAGRVQVP